MLDFFRQCTICRCLLICISVPLLTLLLLLLTSGWWLPAVGHWLDQPSNPEPADVIVVFAGNQERIVNGIALYKQGLAPEIWHTGNMTHSTSPMPNEAQIGREFAIQQGVPPEDITLLETSSTWEDAEQTAALAAERDIEHVLIITSWYHSRRTLCVARRHLADSGVKISFFSAPTSAYGYGPDNWWTHEHGLVHVQNEFVKFLAYWWMYGVGPWSCMG